MASAAAVNGGVSAHFPNNVEPSSYTLKGFKISTLKRPILKAGPIEEMTTKLGIAPPEMIFGDNFVRIEHMASGWGLDFNAFDALDKVDKTGDSMLSVAHSKEWQKTRETVHEGIKEVIKPFDWSYTTDYRGTLREDSPPFEQSTTQIPLDLLRRPDPILFFDEVVLYEDELADNGISMLSVKLRIMPARMLLLCRLFMRLDNVVFRIRDTRVYVDFDEATVIRDYTEKEADFEVVRQQLAGSKEDIPALMRDPNKISELIPVTNQKLERISLR